MKQRIRYRDGRSLDRDLGPGGGDTFSPIPLSGLPTPKVEDRTGAWTQRTGYSSTKPGTVIKWR